MRVRANVRRRWLAWIALVCFIGVFAGGVTAVAAGARRTDTAYPRFLAATRAPDLLVMNHVENPSLASFAPSAVARLPQVVQSGQLDAFVVLHPNDLQVLAPTDRVVGYCFYAKKILSGRLPDPQRPDEVAVSFRAAEAYHVGVGDVLTLGMQPASGHHPVTVSLHLHLGDKVHVSVAGLVDPTAVRVVGTAVFPYLADDVGLGRGADMTVGALKVIVRDGAPPPDTILVGFRAGHDRELQLSRLRQAIGPDAAISVASPQQPADLVNFGRVEDLPVVLGGLLVLLALGALTHMLITSVRVRRHELALLKVLGFLPRQVRSTVIWQAAATSAAALALGLPLGVVLGRVVWLAFANQLGVVAVPMVPLAGVAAIGIGGLVATYLIAVWPADRASRVRVAQALRTG